MGCGETRGRAPGGSGQRCTLGGDVGGAEQYYLVVSQHVSEKEVCCLHRSQNRYRMTSQLSGHAEDRTEDSCTECPIPHRQRGGGGCRVMSLVLFGTRYDMKAGFST